MPTINELIEQRQLLDKQIEELRLHQRSEALKTIHALIAENGLTQQDLYGQLDSGTKPKSSGNRGLKVKVAAKYRNPLTNQEWTGRGLCPKWITESGKDKSEFLIV